MDDPPKVGGDTIARHAAAARQEPPSSGPPPPPDARGTRPPPAPASEAGPLAEAMPSTRIAFSPRLSFSRPSLELDVEAGELAHALEAVVDRVAVGEQALRGARDVAVGVEKGLQRAHQIGLVLLVVGDQRLDRLGVEALQLGGFSLIVESSSR